MEVAEDYVLCRWRLLRTVLLQMGVADDCVLLQMGVAEDCVLLQMEVADVCVLCK